MKCLFSVILTSVLMLSLAACGNTPSPEPIEKAPSLSDSESLEDDFVIQDGVLLDYTGTAGRIVIPETVREIGDRVFSDIDILTVAIPGSVQLIGDGAFEDCAFLEQIDIPANVEYIGVNCFAQCKALTTLSVVSERIFISRAAFYSCGALSAVTLPGSAVLREDVFRSCGAYQGALQPDRVTVESGDVRFAVNVGNVSTSENGGVSVTLLPSDSVPFSINGSAITPAFEVHMESEGTSYTYDTCAVSESIEDGSMLMVFSFAASNAPEYITLTMGDMEQRFDAVTYASRN